MRACDVLGVSVIVGTSEEVAVPLTVGVWVRVGKMLAEGLEEGVVATGLWITAGDAMTRVDWVGVSV